MTTINRKVIDIYHGNDVSSWPAIKAGGIVGVIHKATEGTGNVDNLYRSRRVPALDAGLLWGAYHFAHAGNVQQQVDHFLSITGVDEQTLYALDWEDPPGGGRMKLEDARQFLELIEARIGPNRCVIYSGNVAKEELGNRRDTFFGSHRLWLAQYNNNPRVQQSWSDYWLWQYSDGSVGPQPHKLAGVDGLVDSNSWNGTDAELVTQWSGSNAIPTIQPPAHDYVWLQTVLRSYGYAGAIDGIVGPGSIAAMIRYVEAHEA